MNSVSKINLAGAACVAVFAIAQFGISSSAVAQSQPQPPVRATPAPAKPKPAPQAIAVPSAPAGATQGAARSTDDVVARVGNTEITTDELRSYVAALAPRDQAALARDPAQFSQAVRMLLANRLVLQEVTARKWDQQPAVTAQLDRVRENAVVELYLQSVSTPPDSYPADDEVQKTYDANRAALIMPRQFQLAQLFVAAPKDADKATDDKAKKKVDDIQRKLKAPGADFAAIASADNDAKDGGDLGWLPENQIRPEIQAQIVGLAKNAVSDPVRLDDGWHILKLIDTKAAYTRTLPEVRDQLVQQMRAERATVLRRAYLAELVKQRPPAINELALSKVLAEPGQAVR